MTEAQIKAALTDRLALACTMVAEAGGDRKQGNSSLEERAAVGCTVRNRVRRPGKWGDSYLTVCLARLQFSCWNPGPDANHQRLMRLAYLLVTNQPPMDPLVDETLWLADGIISGLVLDRVGGATHYYAPKAMKPAGRVPSWAVGQQPAAVVGDQLFFRL